MVIATKIEFFIQLNAISLKRTLFFSVLLFFTGCYPSCNPCWKTQSFTAVCFHSERKTFPSSSPYNGLSLEYTEYATGGRFFINLESCLPLDCDPEVTITLYEQEITFPGFVYEGNQRIALPDSITEHILTALANNQTFTVRIHRFQASITSEKFHTNK